MNSKGPLELNDVLQFTSKNILISKDDNTDDIIKVETTVCEDGETANKFEYKNENFMETKNPKFNNELQGFIKDALACEEDGNNVDIVKIEVKSYEEIEKEVEYKDDNFVETDDMKFNTDDIIKLEKTVCEDDETANKFEYKNENFMETKNPKFNSELQGFIEDALACEEDGNNVDIVKIEVKSYEEIEKEVEYKDDNFVETDDMKFLLNEETEIKTDQQDFNSFQDDDLPEPQATNKLRGSQKPVKLLQCEFCSFQTKYKRQLENHSITMHHQKPSEITMYTCEICTYQAKDKYMLNKHSLIHKNPSEVTMYQCESCSYETKYKYGLCHHKQIHKNTSEVMMYRCKSCSFQTKYRHNLISHITTHNYPKKVTIRSHISTHKYPKEVTISSHISTHKYPKEVTIRSHISTHKNPTEVTMHQCAFCSYQTRYKYDLYKHIFTHNNNYRTNNFKCEYCPYETESKGFFKKHLIRHVGCSQDNNRLCLP